jgi:hypothetical protein
MWGLLKMLLTRRAPRASKGRQQRLRLRASSGPSAAARISTVARGVGAPGADQRVHVLSAVHLVYFRPHKRHQLPILGTEASPTEVSHSIKQEGAVKGSGMPLLAAACTVFVGRRLPHLPRTASINLPCKRMPTGHPPSPPRVPDPPRYSKERIGAIPAFNRKGVAFDMVNNFVSSIQDSPKISSHESKVAPCEACISTRETLPRTRRVVPCFSC